MGLEALFRPGSIAVIGVSEKTDNRTKADRLVGPVRLLGVDISGQSELSDGARSPMLCQHRRIAGSARCRGVLRRPRARPRAIRRSGGARREGRSHCVLQDGGFAECREVGRRLQSQIEGIYREASIALCGPNCIGVLSPHHCSSTYLQELRDPSGLAGKVGIDAESSALQDGGTTSRCRGFFLS
jgi:hypothetical protein